MQLLLATMIFEYPDHQHHRVILIPSCSSQNYLNATYSFIVLWLPWPKLQSYVTPNLPTSQSSVKTTMIRTVTWITQIALPCFMCPNVTIAGLCKYKHHDHHRIMWCHHTHHLRVIWIHHLYHITCMRVRSVHIEEAHEYHQQHYRVMWPKSITSKL